MLAHCELFHSKQPWPKLWIMTTSASERICKKRGLLMDRVSGRFREKGAKSDKERERAVERGRDGWGRTDRRYDSFLHNYSHRSHHSQCRRQTDRKIHVLWLHYIVDDWVSWLLKKLYFLSNRFFSVFNGATKKWVSEKPSLISRHSHIH